MKTILFALLLVLVGCGGRAEIWSEPVGTVQAYGLANSVAIIDGAAHRVVALTVPDANLGLAVTSLPTGHNVVATAAQPDGSHLFVLSAGYNPGLGDTRAYEAPTLTIVADGPTPTARAIDLSDKLTDPLNGLAIDPSGRWAVLYAASGTGSAFVTNPNELVIVDTHAAAGVDAITPVSLHSFGGRPERLIFSQQLMLPTGAGHLLIVQSQQDLALLVLENPKAPEITVRLADAAVTTRPHPAQVVIDDGDPARNDDARIGLRFDNDSSVMTLQLGPAAGGGTGNGFTPAINVADVGGVPSDIAFVRTDGGLRLAALVPGQSRAVLVDPATTITTDVKLPASYQRLSLVTGAAGGGAGADVALLWQGSSNFGGDTGVAFWELGQAAGRPFRSIETVGVTASVNGVLDVPMPNEALKVLKTANDNSFYVLDLQTRTAAPLVTASANVALTVSRTGQRVWTFQPQGQALAATDLATKHAKTLHADSPIDGVFEIARGDGTGRALLAVHASGGLGVTVYDADNQDDRTRRIYGAVLTEGNYGN